MTTATQSPDRSVQQAPPGWSLTRPMDSSEFAARRSALHALVEHEMHEGVHYGTLGEGDNPRAKSRMILMKPGAELLIQFLQLAQHYGVKRTDLPNQHAEYHVRCKLLNHRGELVAEGLGSCSTMETRYRYRKASRTCPQCGADAIIKGKKEYGGGWLCFAKKGGCGAKFVDGDGKIEAQEVGRQENPDLADLHNTVLKMAKKRAMVDGAITAAAASDLFGQDLDDDMPPGDDAPRDNPPPAPRQQQRDAAPRNEAQRSHKPANGTPKRRLGQVQPEPAAPSAGDRYRNLRNEARQLCTGVAADCWQDVSEEMGFGRDGKAVATAPPDKLEAFVEALKARVGVN